MNEEPPPFHFIFKFKPNGCKSVTNSVSTKTGEMSIADPILAQSLRNHKNSVTDLSFHPDGNRFVSSSLDGSLFLCNITRNLTKSKERNLKLSQHSGGVTCVQFANNGQLIASGSEDKTVLLWSPKNNTVSQFMAHDKGVCSISLTPDSNHLVTSSNDKLIKIWDVETRKLVNSFTGHQKGICCARYCLNGGDFIISCGEDRTVKVWDVKSRECVHVFEGFKGCGNHLAVNNDGRYVAVAMSSGTVRLYDIKERKLKQHYSLFKKTSCIAWHPSDNYLIAGGCSDAKGIVKIIDIVEGRPVYTLAIHQENASAVTFTAEGDKFASAGSDGNIQVWYTNKKT